MVDHARLALGPRRLAVHAGAGGTAGRADQGEVVGENVIPAKAGIQYAAALLLYHRRLGFLDRPIIPDQVGDRRRAMTVENFQTAKSILAARLRPSCAGTVRPQRKEG